MVLASLSTALIAFVLMVSGNPVSRVMRVHDRLEVVPTGFAAAEMARSETLLHLRIALTARNITGLETVLMSVSAPGSPSYGKYLSLDQVSYSFTHCISRLMFVSGQRIHVAQC